MDSTIFTKELFVFISLLLREECPPSPRGAGPRFELGKYLLPDRRALLLGLEHIEKSLEVAAYEYVLLYSCPFKSFPESIVLADL